MEKTYCPPYVHSFPAPAVVVGCGTLEQPNLITLSWIGTVCSEPQMVSISVRKSRLSHSLISRNREFTVNLPRVQDLDIVKYCGANSGRDGNKFVALNLTPLPCPPLMHAPMIGEFFHTLACRVNQVIELGSHDMFIADVVGIYHREQDRRKLRPDPHAEDQIVYLDGMYWSLTGLNHTPA